MVSNETITFKGIIETIPSERQRRISALKKGDPQAFTMWDSLIQKYDSFSAEKILKAYEFSRSISYEHPGLSSEVYFVHPLRVATYAGLMAGKNDIDFPILGLLHNILEVTSIDKEEIKLLSGNKILKDVETLTVNRSLQWDIQYKITYYKQIEEQSSACRLIKILDKLDNLYLLHLNQDETIKRKYLNEINTFVYPLVVKYVPSLTQYFISLIENTKKLSFK